MRKWTSLVLISSFILFQASVATTSFAQTEESEEVVEEYLAPTQGKATTKGKIGFKADKTIDYPVKPGEKPDEIEKPIDGGNEATEGPYSISYISNIKFGSHVYEKNKNNTFFAKNDVVKLSKNGQTEEATVPNYVQISDGSASSKGWKLYVALEGPLKNENETEIKQMSLRFENIFVSPVLSDLNEAQISSNIEVPKEGIELTGEDTAPKLVAEADGMEGQGRWHILFGKTLENAEKSVSLFIPKNGIKEPGKYKTNLVWTFGNVK